MTAPAQQSRPAIRLISVFVVFALALALVTAGGEAAASAGSRDLATAGVLTASSFQDDVDGRFPPEAATDGDGGTRWASAKGADSDVAYEQWVQLDVGDTAALERIVLSWEAAFAKAYLVQVSSVDPVEAATWKTVSSITAGDGGIDEIVLPANPEARFVRIVMTQRAGLDWEPSRPHYYGYSLYSFEVFGTPAQQSSGSAEIDELSVVDDFESGTVATYTTWAIRSELKPNLSAPSAARAGAAPANHALMVEVNGASTAGEWFGFTRDLARTDWSSYDGFAFWFRGGGSGHSLRFELKSDGQLFEHSVIDSSAGWQQVTVAFADLRLKENATSDVRFNPLATTGFAVTLSDLGAGEWAFDDFALYTRAVTLDDAEGDVPLAAAGSKVGLFPWQGGGGTATLGVSGMDSPGAGAGNHVLAGTYDVPDGGWAGFTHNLPVARDWSTFRGIRFMWYASQEINPASPTAGEEITVEIKDGGSDGESAEKWTATFLDRWGSSASRWKVVELPFNHFSLSAGEIDGSLGLTSAWGFAVKFPASPVGVREYAIDDVEIYGTWHEPSEISLAPAAVTLVEPGAGAQLPVAITTKDGAPLGHDVVAHFATVDGTAQAGAHYSATEGDLTFAAGTESGATKSIQVPTASISGGDVARTIRVELSSTEAEVSLQPQIVINATGMPYLDASLPTAERVKDLVSRMSLEEKVGQMTQAERLGLSSVDDITDLQLGSLLSGGGSVPEENTAAGWADMVDGYQRQALATRLQIPLIYGIDAVHGNNNVTGATIFPHNESLGATRDPALVEAVAAATAREVRATGIPWTFAPCLCVTRDDRWGRSYESFGEDPALVGMFAAAAVTGLQGTDPSNMSGQRVLATGKHWVGDGGTTYASGSGGLGYPIDQGVTEVASLQQLKDLYVAPYLPAIGAGLGSIMPSYSAVSVAGADPVRMHEFGELNNGLLKGEVGFGGFLISDWEAIDKLPGDRYPDKVARAVNAGLDMAMAPYNYADFISATIDHVNTGTIPIDRIDDAVARILTQKFALGLFEQPFADRSLAGSLGSADHRAIARQAAAESQVLLQNDGGVLPLAKDAHIYIAGSNADDLGHQMGGWSISWQGGSGETTQGTTILEGIRDVAPSARVTYSKDASAPVGDASVGIVAVGEPPYAEGVGDAGTNGFSLELSSADTAAVEHVCSAVQDCVVLVVAGRAQVVSQLPGAVDAIVASWLPGSEGAGVADTLFGDRAFTGQLPITWPASADQVPINVGDDQYDPAYAFGWGLRTDDARARLGEAADGLAAGGARDAIIALRGADIWDADGRLSLTPEAVGLVRSAAEQLMGTKDRADIAASRLVVSVVRDLAQVSVERADAGLPPDAAAVLAKAEQRLLSSDPVAAIDLLVGLAGSR